MYVYQRKFDSHPNLSNAPSSSHVVTVSVSMDAEKKVEPCQPSVSAPVSARVAAFSHPNKDNLEALKEYTVIVATYPSAQIRGLPFDDFLLIDNEDFAELVADAGFSIPHKIALKRLRQFNDVKL